jgi:filamentous hemagglutinin
MRAAEEVFEDTYEFVVTRDSGQASLLAGRNITLIAGRAGSGGIFNDKSVVAAGGSIDAFRNEGAFQNLTYAPGRTIKTWSKGQECRREGGDCGPSYDYSSEGEVWPSRCYGPPSVCAVRHEDDTTSARWAENDNGTGSGPEIGQATNDVNVSGPGNPAPTFGSIERVTNDAGGAPGPSSSTPTFTFTIPQSGLYTVHEDPGYPYLVETDPRFTNLKDFLSSSYMLGQLGLDPEATLKRLGDGFYEQRLVLDQVTELTGRRYLAGYSDGEEEFKALMDEGVRYAKELKLKVGVALTADQMSKLTSPMVWLVEENVGGHRVLAPRLYLPAGGVERLKGSGMVTAGNDIYLDMAGDFTNTGTMSAGGNVGIQAANISGTGGSLSAGKELTAVAKKDVTLHAVDIQAQGDVKVFALEGDVTSDTLSRTRHYGTLQSGEWHEKTETLGTTLSSSGGSVSVVGGHDVRLDAAQLEAGKDLVVQAKGGNVVLGGTVDSTTEERLGSSGNVEYYERTYDETWKGTSLVAGGNLSVSALSKPGSPADGQSGNVFLAGATIQGNETVVLYGQNDVITQEGREKHESLTETTKHESSWLGFVSTTTTTHDEVNLDLAVKNQVSGGAALLRGERDLTLRGADVVAAGDVQLSAGRDLTITAAEDYTYESHEKKVVTSGLLSSGVGVMLGTRTEKDRTRIESTSNVGSVVGSVDGSVTIDAGGDARIRGSDVISKERTSISGQNVTIEALTDRETIAHITEVEQAGLGVGLGGGVVDAATGIYGSARRSREVKDERLKALYAVRAARTGYETGKSLLEGASAADGVSVQVGFGISGSRSESVTQIGTVRGSLIQSEGEISITAKGDPNQDKGDLTVTGSTIQGRDLALEASRDVLLQSAANTMDSETGTTSYSASIGLSLGVGKGGAGLGLSAQGSLAMGDEGERNVAHAESTLDASGTLSVKSGRDLTLRGAQASGESLAVEAGRDLLVESEQDTSEYHSKQVSVSGQASIKIIGGGGSTSASASLSKTDSSFKSVAEQSGFYAGSGGYQIEVAGNTHLAGGVIASEAPEEKNLLDTGTLTWSNIGNESKYSAWSVGATVGTGGVTPVVGVPAQGEKRSTTYAAVSPGTIRTKSDTTGLSRDVAKANNPIGDIFDKEKVAEKQELATVFGQEAYRAVGDLAKSKTQPYTDAQLREEQATKYRDLKAKSELTGEEAAIVAQMEAAGYSPESVDGIIAQAHADQERYRGQYETWKDGSVAKVLLHAGAGAAQAGLGGGSILAGGLGAGASEGMAPLTESLSPQARQWASLGIGAAAGGVAGGPGGLGGGALSGGATALTGNQFNRALHESEKAKIKELAKDYLKYGYETEEEAELKLSLAACSMVACAEQIRVDEPGRDDALKLQHAGDDLKKEQDLLRQVSKEDFNQRANEAAQAYMENPLAAKPLGDRLFAYDPINTKLDDLADAYVLKTRAGGALQAIGGAFVAAEGAANAPRACATVTGCLAATGTIAIGVDHASTGVKTAWEGVPYATSFNGLLQDMGLSPEVAAYVEAGTGALAAAGTVRAVTGVGTRGPQTIEVTKKPVEPLGRGSTADEVDRWLPRNLREQAAVEEAMHNPAGGKQMKWDMQDARWPAEDGWVKMQQTINPRGREGPITVHYNHNTVTGDVDDFKIARRAPERPAPEPKVSPTGE